MLKRINADPVPDDFTIACGYEHVFGSKILGALKAYGFEDERASFWLLSVDNKPEAALCLLNGVLIISACSGAPCEEIAQLIKEHNVHETDTNLEMCEKLQKMLGGTTESSYYMVYCGEEINDFFPDIYPGNPEDCFSVLQQSHEYYRSHLSFPVWASDIKLKSEKGLMELYQLEIDGKAVGTGSIGSEDEQCGVLVAVAVIPEYRHRGLGSYISRFLVQRILEKGKTPRLISGYDEVAELYKKIGFEPCGRWGELYL